jgi:hypothetical protein
VFIEITTVNQKLVTKKNRKVRDLAPCTPKVHCKVFYQRDYLHLLVKYGLAAATADSPPPLPTRLPGPPQVVNLGSVEAG